ncbi:hypothetical protein B0I35DRAFT_436051 [Stachybotrys elegans]|uniref:Uncharacterized protein n=1 Tax=Stachybotrys elegans TaxID=80388 RepID=A0A8K0SSQ7_9HYPO|nr:hypothetical protein B0I35DRAFT_436051 [Stachybotrys elegans]
MLNRGGPISKLISGSVGLAKEYKAHSEQRKAAKSQAASSGPAPAPAGQDPYSESDYDSAEDEELLLDMDEAQQTPGGPSAAAEFDEDRMLQTFAQRHPPPATTTPLPSLVLLPQRRPKSQHKGFVRAYAPVLADCAIDQDAWLEFLDGMERSISKSSWFHVTNAGVLVASNAAALTMGISPVAHLASTAIHVGVEAARRGYVNHQQNHYLDVMNEQFFKPRGLYCMVVKYSPSSSDVIQDVNMEQNITQSIGARQDQSKWRGYLNSSAMKIENDIDLPPTAPLVFPGLDEQPSSSFKQFGHVMDDYKNRRAAAKFEAENPNSRMPAAPRKEFASAYGDPNSAANSGGLISLATNGTRTSLGPSGGLADRISHRREARKAKRKQRSSKRPLKKMMKTDALYLMVTNLPSQETVNRVASQMDS